MLDRWERIHDQIEQELEDGLITHKEAYQYHKEVEQEEQDEQDGNTPTF